MKLIKGDIVELDDGKDYVIFNIIDLNNKKYYYLMTAKKPLEIIIAEEYMKDNEVYLKPLDNIDEAREVLKAMLK